MGDKKPKLRVVVPIKLVVPAGSVDSAGFASTLERTVRSKLGQADQAVGTGGTAVVYAPTVSFRGEPLTAGQRADLQQRVTAAVGRAAGGQRPKPKTSADPKANKPVEAKKRARGPGVTWAQFRGVDDPEFLRAFWGVVYGPRFRGRRPDVYGALFFVKGTKFARLFLWNGERFLYATEMASPVLKKEAGRQAQHLNASEDYSLVYLSDASEGSVGASEYHERALRLARQQLGVPDKIVATADVGAPQRELEEQAEASVREYMRDFPNVMGAYFRLEAPSGTSVTIPIPREAMDRGIPRREIPVLALVRKLTAEELGELQNEARSEASADLGGEDVEDEEGDESEGEGDEQRVGGGGDGADDLGIGSEVRGAPGLEKYGRGVVLGPAYDPKGSVFPIAPQGKSRPVICEPYDREPSIDELSEPARSEMMRLIKIIAARLDIDVCEYPAQFCITASWVLAARADQVNSKVRTGDRAFIEELAIGARNAQAGFYYRPFASQSIQYLQHLAGTFTPLRKLVDLVASETAEKHMRKVYFAWGAHWLGKVIDQAAPAAAKIYLYTCQTVLLQLLNSSLSAIDSRQRNIDAYTKAFRVLLDSMLAEQVELITLRTALERFVKLSDGKKGARAYEAVYWNLYWQNSSQSYDEYHVVTEAELRTARLLAEEGRSPELMLKLLDSSNYVFDRARVNKVEGSGAIRERPDGTFSIRDSDGNDRTLEELNATLAVQKSYVEAIDPLVTQLAHNFVDAVRPLVQDPSKVPGFVRDLLQTMRDKNEEVMRKVLDDVRYAFEHGVIRHPGKKEQPTLAGGRFVLEGVHRMAHELVGTHFNNDPFYRHALDSLLGSELGYREFLDDVVFMGGIVLTVICPPLGVGFSLVAGIAIGIRDYEHAKELEELHGALMNPEQVVSYAEVQMQLFMSKLSIGLSVVFALPAAGSALKSAGQLAKGAIRTASKQGVKAMALEVVDKALDQIAVETAEQLVAGLAKELAEEVVENEVMDMLLEPLFNALTEDKLLELHEQGVE